MYNKIRELFRKYREIILYLIFGGLTTVVSLGSYYIIVKMTENAFPAGQAEHWSYQIGHWGSWLLAVAFAFVTNKLLVFRDNEKSSIGLARQIGEFVGVRLASGVLEDGLLTLLIEVFSVQNFVAKIAVSILVVIINYVASKLLIFKKTQDRKTNPANFKAGTKEDDCR